MERFLERGWNDVDVKVDVIKKCLRSGLSSVGDVTASTPSSFIPLASATPHSQDEEAESHSSTSYKASSQNSLAKVLNLLYSDD